MNHMNAFKRIVSILALSFIHTHSSAETYYVDSRLGNDVWSGKTPANVGVTSHEGPWQSLNRLAGAQLSPGDIVELQCGSKWSQTLRIKGSGTPNHPIIIRAATQACENPPSIDGSHGIDAHSWIRHDNNIYRASWPNQKFENASLASSTAGWSSWSSAGDQKLVHETNCPDVQNGCAAFISSPTPGGSLVHSNSFHVESGIGYNGGISLRIPAGIRVKVLVRRGSPPYEPISGVLWVTGTGAWQRIGLAFTARNTISDARFDMENAPEGTKFHFRNASLTATVAIPLGAWVDELPLLPAHHPNRGHDAERPDSVYARVGKDANIVRSLYDSPGSSYLDIDANFGLPPGAAPRPGNRLRIRTAEWHLDEVTITKVEGNRLHFQPTTRYPVKAGQGYFMLDEPSVLDSPGEWAYDLDTSSVYAWMPDSSTPSYRKILVSILEKGADFSGKSNIIVEGINIRHTKIGIDLSRAQNITLRSTGIKNTIAEGILAPKAMNINLISNHIQNTGNDAITAKDATTVRVEGNNISHSAVITLDGSVWSLPVMTTAAIHTGAYSHIINNRLEVIAGIGIWPQANWIASNGVIDSNAILDSCLLENDCSAIYVNASSPGTRISHNLVERVKGNIDGLNPNTRIHTTGIYLDNQSTGMIVEGNKVTGAEYGIHVHDAYKNHINANLLYGNSRSQIWFQENSNKVSETGDVRDNAGSGNYLFPTTPTPAITISGNIGNMANFGVLSENYYFSLFSKYLINEYWPQHGRMYTLAEWKTMSNSQGRQGQDTGSSQIAEDGYATYTIAGGNIVPNGNLGNGKQGWISWNATAPLATSNHESCSLGPCIRITAGGSATLISSPNFHMEADQIYRVTFDAKTSAEGNLIVPLVRRGGPTLYDRLMLTPERFSGSTSWRRYSFKFKALKTIRVADPTTGDLGARLDFESILPGQVLWIANIEIVPLRATENTLRTHIITNPGRDTQSYECPDQDIAPEHCSRYRIFPEGTPVDWPIDLPPLGAVPIYTTNEVIRDTDNDGIADGSDRCSDTLENEQVNAMGCALGQTPTSSEGT